jgi:pullulanase/glycogen debranching enzyme
MGLILAGDEFANAAGQQPAYGLDNEISWLN